MDYIRQKREENMELKEANRFKDKELEQKAEGNRNHPAWLFLHFQKKVFYTFF